MLTGVTMTATWRRTRSAANSGNRLASLCAQRYSIATLRPSTKPVSLKPLRKAATRMGVAVRHAGVEEANHRNGRLLRACRDRPRRRRAAKKRDELPPPQVEHPAASALGIAAGQFTAVCSRS